MPAQQRSTRRRCVESSQTESGLARDAAAVVTLSHTMGDVLQNRGVPGEQISLMPNGIRRVPTRGEPQSPAQAHKELGAGLPFEALVVGAMSALIDYEGHDILLRAVAEGTHGRCHAAGRRIGCMSRSSGTAIPAPALETWPKSWASRPGF